MLRRIISFTVATLIFIANTISYFPTVTFADETNASMTTDKVAYLSDAYDSLIKVPVSSGIHVEQIELNLLRLAAINKSIDVFSQDAIRDDLKSTLSKIYTQNMSDYTNSSNTPIIGKNKNQIGVAMAPLGVFSDSEPVVEVATSEDGKDKNVSGEVYDYESVYAGESLVAKYVEALVAKCEKLVEWLGSETNANIQYTGLVYVCDVVNLCSEFTFDGTESEVKTRLEKLRNTSFKDTSGTEYSTLAEAKDALTKAGKVSALNNTSAQMFGNTPSSFEATRLYQAFLEEMGDKNYYYKAEMLAGKALSAAYVPLRTNVYDNPYIDIVENDNFKAFNNTYGKLRKALYIATNNKSVSQYVLTSKLSAFRPAILRDLIEDVEDEKLFVVDPNYYNANRLENWEFPGDDTRVDFKLESDDLYGTESTTQQETSSQEENQEVAPEVTTASASSSGSSSNTNMPVADGKYILSEDGQKWFIKGTEISNGTKTFRLDTDKPIGSNSWLEVDANGNTKQPTRKLEYFYKDNNKGTYYVSKAIQVNEINYDNFNALAGLYFPVDTYASLTLHSNDSKTVPIQFISGRWRFVGSTGAPSYEISEDSITASNWAGKFTSWTLKTISREEAMKMAGVTSTNNNNSSGDKPDWLDKLTNTAVGIKDDIIDIGKEWFHLNAILPNTINIFKPVTVFADESSLLTNQDIKNVIDSEDKNSDEYELLTNKSGAGFPNTGVYSPIDNAIIFAANKEDNKAYGNYLGKYNIHSESMWTNMTKSNEVYSSKYWFTYENIKKGEKSASHTRWDKFLQGNPNITNGNVAAMAFILAYANAYDATTKYSVNFSKILTVSSYEVLLNYYKAACSSPSAVEVLKHAVASHVGLAARDTGSTVSGSVDVVNNLAKALAKTNAYTYDEKKQIMIAAINACYSGKEPQGETCSSNYKQQTEYMLLDPLVIAFSAEHWSDLSKDTQSRIREAYNTGKPDHYYKPSNNKDDVLNVTDQLVNTISTKVFGTASEIKGYIGPAVAMVLHVAYLNKLQTNSEDHKISIMSDTTKNNYANFFNMKDEETKKNYDKLSTFVTNKEKLKSLFADLDLGSLSDALKNWINGISAQGLIDTDTANKLNDSLFTETGSMEVLQESDVEKFKKEILQNAVKSVFKTWYEKKYKFDLPLNKKEQATLLGSKLLREQIDVSVTKNIGVENTQSYNEWYGIAFEFDAYNHPTLANTIIHNESKPVFRSSPTVVNNSTYMDYTFNYMLLKNMEETYPIRWDSVLDLDSPIFVDIYGNILTESGLVVIPFAANSTLHTKISLLNNAFLHSYGSAMSLTLSKNYLTESDIAYIGDTYFTMNDEKIMNKLTSYPALSTAGIDTTNILIPDEETGQWIINPIKIQTDVGNLDLHKIEASDVSTAKALYNLALSAYTHGVSDETIDVKDTYINVGHDIGSILYQVMRGAPIDQIDYSVEKIGSGINYDKSILSQAIKFERLEDQLKHTFQNSIITVPDLTTLPGIQYIIYFTYKILIIIFTLYLLLQVYISASSQVFGLGTVFKITVAFAAISLSVFSLPFVYKYTYYYTNRALLQDEAELISMLNLEKKMNNVELGITNSRNIETTSKIMLKMHDVRTDYVSFLDKMRNAVTASDVTSYFQSYVTTEPETFVSDYELRGNTLYYDVEKLYDTSVITVDTNTNTIIQMTTGTPAASFRLPYYAILDYLIYQVNSYNKLIDSYDYGTFSVGDGSLRTIGLTDRYFRSSAFRLTQEDVLNSVDELPSNIDPSILIFATYDKAGMYQIYGRTSMDNRTVFDDRSGMIKCQWYADAINAQELDALASYLDNEAVSWIIKNEDMLCRVSDETILKSLALHLALKYNSYLNVDGPKSFEIDRISTNDILRLCVADRDGVMSSSPYTYPKFILVKSGMPGIYLGALLSLVTFLLAAAKPLVTIITFFILIASLVVLRVLMNIKTENLKGCIKLAVFLSIVNISYSLALKFMLILPDSIPSFIRIIFMIALHMSYLALYIWLLIMLIVNWKDCGSLAFSNIVRFKSLNIKTISKVHTKESTDRGWDVYNRLKDSDRFRGRR